jgi:hypothetical protein
MLMHPRVRVGPIGRISEAKFHGVSPLLAQTDINDLTNYVGFSMQN